MFGDPRYKLTRSNAAAVAIMAFLLAAGAGASYAQSFVERLLPGAAFAGLTPGPDGRYYGVTYDGGTFGHGTIYSVDAAVGAVTVHYNFAGGVNGGAPYDELTFDAVTGKFYGTTSVGGTAGLIFSFAPGAGSITIVRSDFGSFSQPQGPFVISAGFIFGAIGRGGTNGGGAVFRMPTDGSTFTVLHEFIDFDSLPQAITLGTDGLLYGNTMRGGVICDSTRPTERCGTLFKLRRVLPGDTDTQFQTIFTFQFYRGSPCPTAPPDPNCVEFPLSRASNPVNLIYGSDGLLYGTTSYSIFRIDPHNANPASTFQFLWSDSGGSGVDIVEGSDGRLYANDYDSGVNFAGLVFLINRDGTGFTALRTFSYTGGLTAYGPYGKLFRTAGGVIYGTTEYTNTSPFHGSVFSIQQGSPPPPPAPPAKLKIAGGNLLVGSPGEGFILRSPNGTTCVKIGIDNSGALTNVVVTCP